MIRRLVFSFLTLATIGAASAQQALPSLPFAAPRAVITYSNVNYDDYRPAINGPDDRIVFERAPFVNGVYPEPDLYVANLGSSQATRFVTNVSPTTRPDWCYDPGRPNYDGPIVFTQGETGPIYIKSSQAGPAGPAIKNTENRIYPTWYPGCYALALYAIDALNSPSSQPGPALLGTSTQNGIPARYLTGRSVWAGFSSINPISPYLITFAGQPFNITNTLTTKCKTGYQQDCNYVYIAVVTNDGVQVRPLDAAASVNTYSPQYQGRAPSWSPDGRWIAFESNRACSSLGFYAIFVQDGLHPSPARQVTECKWNAQHAKWYHHLHAGRALLIVSVLRYPNADPTNAQLSGARTISSLDVTDFITSPGQK